MDSIAGSGSKTAHKVCLLAIWLQETLGHKNTGERMHSSSISIPRVNKAWWRPGMEINPSSNAEDICRDKDGDSYR